MKDDEVYGKGNLLAFDARVYSSRFARWFSTDPLTDKYPNYSPYSFGLDNPIMYKDQGGKFITDNNGRPIYTIKKAV